LQRQSSASIVQIRIVEPQDICARSSTGQSNGFLIQEGLFALATLFLEDAVINPPDEPAVKGRAALTEFSDRPQLWFEITVHHEHR
jgi:hypothetical protein